MPVLVVNLDLSGVFDEGDWTQLWNALKAYGGLEVQGVYWQQGGCVQSGWGDSDAFARGAGVRQGCVLSPRPFTTVLQWAMLSCSGPCINKEEIWKQQVWESISKMALPICLIDDLPKR